MTYTLESVKTKLTVREDGQDFKYAFAVTGQVHVTERQSGKEPQPSAAADFVKACMTDALQVLDATDCDPLGLARTTAQQYLTVTQETARSQLSGCDKAVSVNLKS